MTEYDYSPDAVERFYAKQNSVARWVDRQAHEAHAYGNPFVPNSSPSTSGASSPKDTRILARSVSSPVDPNVRHGRPSTSHRSSHREHRDPHRSNTSNPTLVQNVHRYSSGAGTPAGSGSHTHSRSHSQSAAHNRPPPSRSRTYALAQASASATHLPTSRSPVRSQTVPPPLPTHGHQSMGQYTSAPGQPVVMQNGHQTYVVVPPHGTRVQVCSPTSQPVSPTYPQGYTHAQVYPQAVYAQPVSPTSASSKKQPFLKRIFGSSSNSHANSGATNYSRRSGSTVPVHSAAGARRRTTSMHY